MSNFKNEIEHKLRINSTSQTMEEFRQLNFQSTKDVVEWLSKWINCQTAISNIVYLLPTLLQNGFVPLDKYFKLYPEDFSEIITIDDYIKKLDNAEQMSQYIISTAITDLKTVGHINENLNDIIELYNKKFNQQKQKKF